MIRIVSEVNGEYPTDLAKAINGVTNYPMSHRLAGDLYNSGYRLLREAGLWLPLIPYCARLLLSHSEGCCELKFRRGFNYDIMWAAMVHATHGNGVEILRAREEFWQKLSPKVCFVFEVNCERGIFNSMPYPSCSD